MPDGRAYTAAEIRAAEQPLLEAEVPLMARAAAALADVVREVLERLGDGDHRVLVLVGSGNNGGDALFAAADVLAEGDRERHPMIDLLLTGSSTHESGLAAATAAGARIVDAAEARSATYDVVIDGILGTGTTGAPALRGIAREVVETLLPAVEKGSPIVVAVDLPSGLHPDEGTTVDGLVLPASVTVTFGGMKAGLVRGRGPALAGRVVVAGIGLGLT